MSDKKPLIYLASPYSYAKVILRDPLDRVRKREVEQLRFEDVCRFAAKLFAKGYLVFSPIAHTHPLAVYGGLPEIDYKLWLGLDQPFIEASVGLIVVHMPGWETSYGVTFEIDQFVKLNKPIRHFSWPELQEIIPQ